MEKKSQEKREKLKEGEIAKLDGRPTEKRSMPGENRGELKDRCVLRFMLPFGF